MRNLLSLYDVSKQFRATDPPAVDRLNLNIRAGEILALVGQSGSGKTTTLRIIAGFEQPDSGTVELNGSVVAETGAQTPVEHRGIGMVFQEHALFPHLTVRENVAFGLRDLSDRHRNERITELLELTGLRGFEERYPYELSGGQLQRVGLARALAPQPQLILLDEPFNNLDNSLRTHLVREMRDILKRTGTAALFVSHHRDEMFAMADRVAFMRSGALEQIGPPRDVYLRPASRFVAEFFGPINVIPAAYLRNSVQTAFGTLPAGSPRSDNGAPNCACELLVRPHEIGIENGSTGTAHALAIRGEVVEKTFHGEYQELRVRPLAEPKVNSATSPAQPQEPLTVRTSGTTGYRIGDSVSLTIEAQVISCCACRPELDGRAVENQIQRSKPISRIFDRARAVVTGRM